MVGRQVLDQDEGHAAVGGHMGEKGGESLKATRRSADPYDQVGFRLLYLHVHIKGPSQARGRPFAQT
jgi:hypothetical protein